MNILFFLAGNDLKASSRVRGYWIADELNKRGHRCRLSWKHSYLHWIKMSAYIPFQQLVIFQKTYSRNHKLLARWARIWGCKIYLDIDDAPSRINAVRTLANFEWMARTSHAVFAGSQALVDYVKTFQKQVYLIPSSIVLDRYPLASGQSDKPCIAWIGNGKHYKEDLLTILLPALKELGKENSFRFKLIGASEQVELHATFKSFEGMDVTLIDALNWSDPLAVSQSLDDVDIGVYPLLTNAFNAYKCGFKALEYMAKGIPVVSDDVAYNRNIIQDGVNGYMVHNKEEWVAALQRLLDSKTLRTSLGSSGRRVVEQSFSVPSTVDKILEIID